MSGRIGISFQGHLIDHFDNGFVIYSKHIDKNTPVIVHHDYITTLVSLVYLSKSQNLSIHTNIEGIDTDVISSLINFAQSSTSRLYHKHINGCLRLILSIWRKF